MVDETLARFINLIYSTNGTDFNCEQLQAVLPAYVENELSLGSGLVEMGITEEQLESIRIHLDFCTDCNDICQSLRHVVTLTSEDELPDVQELLAEFTEPVEF